MGNYEIIFYQTKQGDVPAKEFLFALGPAMQAKFFYAFDLLQEFGPDIRGKHTKPIRNGIFEIREKAETGIARMFFFFVIGKRIIITNGFIKKTQKTPAKEIIKAEKYREDYLSREGL